MKHRQPKYTNPKYLVKPGWVRSVNDGDWHFLSVDQLVRLYGVDRRECIVYHEWLTYGTEGLTVLEPQRNGDYSL